MIKPTDVSPIAPSATADFIQQLDVEDSFDAAIRQADASGNWPALVHAARDGVSTAVIDAVVAKYRAAGWRIDSVNGIYLDLADSPIAQRPWTIDEIAESYLSSVRARFERHNQLVVDYAIANLGPGAATESELWALYERCSFRWAPDPIGGPCVTVALPPGHLISLAFLDMFDRHPTLQHGPFVDTLRWANDPIGGPALGIIVEVGLVDAWNDARQAWWRMQHDAEGRPRS
jgi:hypothetical protein